MVLIILKCTIWLNVDWLAHQRSNGVWSSGPLTPHSIVTCRFLPYHHVWSWSPPRKSFERQVQGIVQSTLRTSPPIQWESFNWLKVSVNFYICGASLLIRSSQGVLRLQKAQLWYISTLWVNKFFCSYFMGHQNVLQGARNFIIKGSNFYSAQNVCSVMMVVINEILNQFFFSRWNLTNKAAAFRMIHFPFPRNQIQVLYLQVMRTFLRNWRITLHLKIRGIYRGNIFYCMVWEALERLKFVWSLWKRWLTGIHFWFIGL